MAGDDDKLTLDEAKAALKEKGFVVMPQKNFDEIVDEKYGKGFNKGKAEATEGLSAEQKEWKKSHEELQKVKTKLDALEKEKPDLIPRSEHEQLLKNEQDKTNKALEDIKGLRTHQKDNELLKAISPWAVDPDAALALSREKFALGEDGKVYPVNEKGEKLTDSEGYVTTERFFQNFQKEKAYLVKASGSSGAGSETASGGNKAAQGTTSWDDLADMPMEQFIKAGGIANAALPTAGE